MDSRCWSIQYIFSWISRLNIIGVTTTVWLLARSTRWVEALRHHPERHIANPSVPSPFCTGLVLSYNVGAGIIFCWHFPYFLKREDISGLWWLRNQAHIKINNFLVLNWKQNIATFARRQLYWVEKTARNFDNIFTSFFYVSTASTLMLSSRHSFRRTSNDISPQKLNFPWFFHLAITVSN